MEYKFRGFSKDFSKWVYGSLLNTPSGTFILEEGDSVDFVEPEYHASGMGCGLEDRNITDRYEAMQHGFDRAVEKMAESFPPFIEVIPETVGMWTGLKDKNGTDIYEGDIVQFRSTDSYEYDSNYDYEKLGDTPILAVMRWSIEACGFRAAFQSRFKVTVSMLEVVGNMHDNPQLLKPLEGERINMDPNAKQPDELKSEQARDAATEQLPAPTAGEALESAALDQAVGADAEEGGVEG